MRAALRRASAAPVGQLRVGLAYAVGRVQLLDWLQSFVPRNLGTLQDLAGPIAVPVASAAVAMWSLLVSVA